MTKPARKYLENFCKKHSILYPHGLGCVKIKKMMEDILRAKGFSEYEIRQEFSSDWEVITL